jgi:hypothetical protein
LRRDETLVANIDSLQEVDSGGKGFSKLEDVGSEARSLHHTGEPSFSQQEDSRGRASQAPRARTRERRAKSKAIVPVQQELPGIPAALVPAGPVLTPFPLDWEVDARLIGYTFNLTEWEEPRIRREFLKFKFHYCKTGALFADWVAAWFGWCMMGLDREETKRRSEPRKYTFEEWYGKDATAESVRAMAAAQRAARADGRSN